MSKDKITKAIIVRTQNEELINFLNKIASIKQISRNNLINFILYKWYKSMLKE